MELKIFSTAFKDNENIPGKYTCDGTNTIPPIIIEGVDQRTVSLALIMDDPDAAKGTFDHWIMYNIPPSTKKIDEGKSPEGLTGLNGVEKTTYIGPCPPPGSGRHRYFFKLYSLDIFMPANKVLNKKELLELMENHVLQSAEFIGIYSR